MYTSSFNSIWQFATMSSLLVVSIVGPPLNQWNPATYVNSWLVSGWHAATDLGKAKSVKAHDAPLVKDQWHEINGSCTVCQCICVTLIIKLVYLQQLHWVWVCKYLVLLMLCIEKLHCYAILCLVMYACRVIFKWEILYCLVNVVATKLNMT